MGVDDDKEVATVDGLEQGYVVCPSEKRLLLLFTFLKKNRKKKVVVFFSSCMSVKYHYELLNYIDLPVLAIHVSGGRELVKNWGEPVHLGLEGLLPLNTDLSGPSPRG